MAVWTCFTLLFDTTWMFQSRIMQDKKNIVYVSKLRLKDVKKMLKVDVKGRPVKTISC